MLKLSLSELLLRAIPEGVTFLLGVHVYTNTPVPSKNLVRFSAFIGVLIYMIRMLPISYGIHTILGILLVVVIVNKIYCMDVVKAIKGTIITVVIQFVSEVVNMFFIQNILQKDLEQVFLSPASKIIYGLPSLVVAAIIMFLYYIKCGKGRVKK
ncbi:MAG: hypothetical protein ACRCTE_03960 [Cellulosilyticaceae bacterium]